MLIVGRNGSGKSVALRWIMARASRAILADPKGRAHIDGWPTIYGLPALRKAWPTQPCVVARPAPLEDRAEWLDGLCRLAYYGQELILGIDEIVGIASANRPIRWLDAVQTQGRELGITTLICSQRPVGIPMTLRSEAEHVLVFSLNLDEDRDAVAKIIGPYVDPGFRTYRPVYWGGGLDRPVECAAIEL